MKHWSQLVPGEVVIVPVKARHSWNIVDTPTIVLSVGEAEWMDTKELRPCTRMLDLETGSIRSCMAQPDAVVRVIELEALQDWFASEPRQGTRET